MINIDDGYKRKAIE